ncbi:unnamed protein product [Trifolium pratense]|uniref:Uncharacterized protein n=1 Tax=Trifolium pratense TaxID=57577 RepID=A0ACB0K855_TRIPR|nr:unnamed protein product [Trifolium pratense]
MIKGPEKWVENGRPGPKSPHGWQTNKIWSEAKRSCRFHHAVQPPLPSIQLYQEAIQISNSNYSLSLSLSLSLFFHVHLTFFLLRPFLCFISNQILFHHNLQVLLTEINSRFFILLEKRLLVVEK